MAPAVSSDTEAVFQALRQEALLVHGKWIVFRDVFANHQEERLPLLQSADSTFFSLALYGMLDRATTDICRLTDSVKTGGQDNMVLGQLVASVEKDVAAAKASGGDPSEVKSLEELLENLRERFEDAKTECVPLRQRRNKLLAHWDYKLALKQSATPLPGISRDLVQRNLRAIANFLNEYEKYLGTGLTLFYPSWGNAGRALIYTLQMGEAYQRLSEKGEVPRLPYPPRSDDPL